MALKINGIELHKNVTMAVLSEAVMRRISTLDNPGFCILCGHEQEGCEPDAENYVCEACGAEQVFGAEELLMRLV